MTLLDAFMAGLRIGFGAAGAIVGLTFAAAVAILCAGLLRAARPNKDWNPR